MEEPHYFLFVFPLLTWQFAPYTQYLTSVEILIRFLMVHCMPKSTQAMGVKHKPTLLGLDADSIPKMSQSKQACKVKPSISTAISKRSGDRCKIKFLYISNVLRISDFAVSSV
jgi:hypothetical protein